MPGTKFIQHPTQAHATHIVAFCTRSTLGQLTGPERLAFCLDSDLAPLPQTTALRGYIDAATDLILSTEVPNPTMPAGDKDEQLGQKANSLGRLLPGLIIESTADGLKISGLLPNDARSASIPGVKMDDQGFLVSRQLTPT